MDTGLLIKHIHDSLEKKANNELRDEDLTLMQVSILIELKHAVNGEMTMKEIEHRFHIAQSTTAGIVSRMKKEVCKDIWS